MWIAILLFAACETEDPYADWDTAGWDAEDDWRSNDPGEEEPTGASDSCQFGNNICIETTAVDPAVWCATEGGTSNGDACANGATNYCDVPGGQDGPYADAATVFLYNDFDWSTICSDFGGTYN